jgi:superoxide dismutase, Cu-Zn family
MRRPLAVAAALALVACNGDDRDEGAESFTMDTVATAPATGMQSADEMSARTTLLDAQGDSVGTATFTQVGESVRIAISVQGMQPGEKGIHIHQVGRCDAPTFESAGSHFAPAGAQHGFENPEGPHAGDLRNLNVGADGSANQELTTDLVTLHEGSANSLFDADGSALVVHAGPDDYRTDPSGDSGDRVACGVISRGG